MALLAAWLRLGLSAGMPAIAATTWLNPSIRGLDGAVFGAWLLAAVLLGTLVLGLLHAALLRTTTAWAAAPSRSDLLLAAMLGASVLAVTWLGLRDVDSSVARGSLFSLLGAVILSFSVPAVLRLAEPHRRSLSRAASLGLSAAAFLGTLACAALLVQRTHVGGEDAAAHSGSAVPVLLIGIDGADWNRIDPLIAAGRLPSIAALARTGTRAPLRSMKPTWSPALWNSMVTGLPPEEHGILDFFETRFPGQSCGVQRLDRRLGEAPLTPSSLAMRPIITAFSELGILDDLPVTNCTRRAKAIWNLVSEAGGRSAVVSWWGTWPSEPIQGAMVADMNPYRSYLVFWDHAGGVANNSGVTHPPELFGTLPTDAIPQLPTRPEAVIELPFFARLTGDERADLAPRENDLTKFFPNVLGSDRFAGSSMEALLGREPFDFSAVHLSAIDEVSHRWGRYPSLVDAAYEFIDSWVGRIVAAAPPGTVVVLASDHGWAYVDDAASGHKPGHHQAPDGVFVINGPGIPKADLETAPHILDVGPTLLALLGIAADERMTGEAIRAVLPEPSLAILDAPRPRYADRTPNPYLGPLPVKALGDGMTDRLRALGYLEE